MDSNISRIVAGAVYGVQPKYKKRQGKESDSGEKFTLDPAPRKAADPATESSEESASHDHLHVSKPEQGEAGSQLDLTA